MSMENPFVAHNSWGNPNPWGRYYWGAPISLPSEKTIEITVTEKLGVKQKHLTEIVGLKNNEMFQQIVDGVVSPNYYICTPGGILGFLKYDTDTPHHITAIDTKSWSDPQNAHVNVIQIKGKLKINLEVL